MILGEFHPMFQIRIHGYFKMFKDHKIHRQNCHFLHAKRAKEDLESVAANKKYYP